MVGIVSSGDVNLEVVYAVVLFNCSGGCVPLGNCHKLSRVLLFYLWITVVLFLGNFTSVSGTEALLYSTDLKVSEDG